MNQPTLPDGPPVPLMVDGLIDAVTVRQLFADLATSATILGVRHKGDPTHYTGANDMSLDEAQISLLTGAQRSVQIRYYYAGYEWTDTLFSLSIGYRVVRCRHE